METIPFTASEESSYRQTLKMMEDRRAANASPLARAFATLDVERAKVADLQAWKTDQQQFLIAAAAKLFCDGFKGDGILEGIEWLRDKSEKWPSEWMQEIAVERAKAAGLLALLVRALPIVRASKYPGPAMSDLWLPPQELIDDIEAAIRDIDMTAGKDKAQCKRCKGERYINHPDRVWENEKCPDCSGEGVVTK